MICFYFKSNLSLEGTMPDANIEKDRFSSSVVRKCHTTEVFLIPNKFITSWYGSYTQFINNKPLI
jgi:hypothetical protein